MPTKEEKIATFLTDKHRVYIHREHNGKLIVCHQQRGVVNQYVSMYQPFELQQAILEMGDITNTILEEVFRENDEFLNELSEEKQ